MKTLTFENIMNKEQFLCTVKDLKSPEIIEGIEYVKVMRVGTVRTVLMRKDVLRQIKHKIQ